MRAKSTALRETFRFDPSTVAMKHPDGLVALLSGSAGVTAHYTSPPFHQRERKNPNIRTIQTTNDVLGGSDLVRHRGGGEEVPR